MNTLTPIAVSVLCAFVLSSAAQESGGDDIKYNMDHLEKTWGIKLKSAQLELKMVGGSEVKLLLEFTKDVENLEEMREAFTPTVFTSPKDTRSPKLYFYFFDEDNVALGKLPIKYCQSELTGKKGDAFRITIGQISGTDLKKTRKLEARPAVKEKR